MMAKQGYGVGMVRAVPDLGHLTRMPLQSLLCCQKFEFYGRNLVTFVDDIK